MPTRTPAGDATIAITNEGDVLRCEALGPGAEHVLDRAHELVGVGAEQPSLDGPYPIITDLARRFPGVRLPRSDAVMASLVPAILEQKVTGNEARRAWQGPYAAWDPGPPWRWPSAPWAISMRSAWATSITRTLSRGLWPENRAEQTRACWNSWLPMPGDGRSSRPRSEWLDQVSAATRLEGSDFRRSPA